MKKTLLILFLTVFSLNLSRAQCVSTCSNYAVSPITFSLFANSGTTVNSMFTPTPDDGTVTVPIGFNFNFYCSTYTTVNICTNGFMQFDYGNPINFGNPPYVNPTQSFPDAGTPNGLVALRMDDYDVGAGGSVSYTTVGTAPNRMFVLTYNAVPIWYNALINSPPTPVYTTGQIVLYETSNIIEIHSGTIDLSPNLATQGIESETGLLGVGVPARNNALWSANNSAYQFAPFSPAPPTAIMGNASLCEGAQSSYSITTQTGATSYSWSVPAGWSGTSTTTAVSTTAGASGNLSVTATYTCGTSAATTLSVNVTPAPVVSILSVDPFVVCSGSDFTITPSGGLTYTLDPGGITTSSVFIVTATTFTNFSLSGSDANCSSFNTATTSIIINESPTVTVNSGSMCVDQQFTISPVSSNSDSYLISGGFSIVSPTAAGVYSYQVIANNSTTGCNSLPALSTLTVNANPSLTLTAARSNICTGESVKLTAGGATTYTWTGGLNTNSISVSPTITTTYTLTGETPEGCSKFKTISVAVSPCVGIKELNSGNSAISVYPNPSNGMFNIQINGETLNTSIEVYDVTGRLVLSQKANQTANEINLVNQANGLYYVKVKNSEIQETLKIIKQ